MQNGKRNLIVLLHRCGLYSRQLSHKLFLHFDNNCNVEIVHIKIVDEILASGTDHARMSFLSTFGIVFNFGDVCHGPGKCHSLVSTQFTMMISTVLLMVTNRTLPSISSSLWSVS